MLLTYLFLAWTNSHENSRKRAYHANYNFSCFYKLNQPSRPLISSSILIIYAQAWNLIMIKGWWWKNTYQNIKQFPSKIAYRPFPYASRKLSLDFPLIFLHISLVLCCLLLLLKTHENGEERGVMVWTFFLQEARKNNNISQIKARLGY